MTNENGSPGEGSATADGHADPDAPVDFTPGELDEPVDPDDDGHEVNG